MIVEVVESVAGVAVVVAEEVVAGFVQVTAFVVGPEKRHA